MTDLERLKAYDELLSEVMPLDFKDWHQGSKDEWPQIAAWVIESLREREEFAWQQVEFAYEKMKNKV